MNISARRKTLAFVIGLMILSFNVFAQEYFSATAPPKTGRSPGVKVKLISEDGKTKTYSIIFTAGDEILSGLKEFAVKYGVKSAHFTAIGDARTARFGWYDKSRKMFKVTSLNQYAEITSLVGDIALNDSTPVVHGHIALATEDGLVHGGHLLEAIVEPTLEVMMTVESEPLKKKLSREYNILLIDPDLP